ncbi:hypothetical protein [Agromyces seonyuensis]|uniref:Uncharacterized protein n=1 Tax=Agromyces seonyuensis TaxID=2662446 RepID=A0A6I4P3I1_9MICO|nr:hypothetical protein [Agromyces seonyuensis]MWB97784.1 hypothetical protein [Agromyces seonyuensis]
MTAYTPSPGVAGLSFTMPERMAMRVGMALERWAAHHARIRSEIWHDPHPNIAELERQQEALKSDVYFKTFQNFHPL